MIRRLNVWWDGRIVGELTQDEHGELGFAYASAWVADASALPLSASLPKRAELYPRRACRPFFGGLLPEEVQRDAAAQALGVSRANDFALLDRLGGDVAGALILLPPGETPAEATHGMPAPLDDDALIALLDRLPAQPLLAGQEGLRLSLAGAQAKVPVVLSGDAVALPTPGQPTTHILKPPIPRFAATTENETYAMRLAAHVGLDVAHAEARVARDRAFLLVRRHDRAQREDGSIRRIHQEDFCQALGIPSERKYAAEGGPTLRDCFALIRRVSAVPAVDLLKMLDATVFNLVVGNADAHGKNFSFLHEAAGTRFAPLYDLLSTVLYPEISSKLAMKIGKRATLEEMDAGAWTDFAAETELGLPLVRRRVGELCGKVKAEAENVAHVLARPGLDTDALARQAAAVTRRAGFCAGTVKPVGRTS